jgi:hypothetical protein
MYCCDVVSNDVRTTPRRVRKKLDARCGLSPTQWRNENRPVNEPKDAKEKRRHERLQLDVDVTVLTGSALVPGRSYDISVSGISVVLPVELTEGQEVKLQISFPRATETIRAIVRQRNVFRHGFEFVEPLQFFSGSA